MADWTLPSTRFCAENYPLMKQLKPFRFYDDASQEKVLLSAWTKLNGKNKQYYVNLVKDQPSKGYAKDHAIKNILWEALAFQDDNDDAFEIYRTEMRLILLQDPVFVKDHYHELQAVIKEGWNGLSMEQQNHFNERVVLATKDGYTENPQEMQTSVTFGWGHKYLDRYDIQFGVGFNQTRSPEWTSHDYKILTNTTDSTAFEEFANFVHAEEPSLVGKVIWEKWMGLNHEEREFYYRKAYKTAASIDADKIFLLEKQTIVVNRYNKYDRIAYNTELMELQSAWNDISDEARKVYFDEALAFYLERDHNPETRFIGTYNYSKDKLLARVTTIDDVNSELTPQLPFNFVYYDNENTAFFVYMEKMRPELLKQPVMIQKRLWEVNFVLWKQWKAMSEEEQKPYNDTVRRFLKIRTIVVNITNRCKLEAWKVFGNDYEHRYQFAKLDEGAKQRYGKIALQNRKTLLNYIPDLHDYYYWIKHEQNMSADVSVSMPTSSSSINTVEKAEKTVSQPQKNAYSPKYEYLMYTDASDVEAFQEYQKSVDAVVFTYTNVWWRQFVNLTDEERNVYYDKAIKTAAGKQASTLFALENCTVINHSEEDDAFANEVLRLNETWKTLCSSAKNHYVELAEKNLRKREKEKPEDDRFKNNGVYYCNIDNDNIRCNGQLVSKYTQLMYNLENPEKNAFTVYIQKHFAELYNQPEMADKRYFQLCFILEERFMDLSDEERQVYLDIVRVVNTIKFEIQNLPITTKDVYYQKHMTLQHWQKASYEEKAVCEEQAKQNFKTLMERYPALTEHFHWMVYGQALTESQAETSTNVKTAATEEPPVTNETTTEAEYNATREVVHDEIVKDKTLPHEVEEVKYIKPNLEFGGHVEALADTIEQTIAAETPKQKNDSVELDSAKLQKPLLNATTSKESESTVIWKAVDNEKNTEEIVPLKSTEEPRTSGNSAQATKTPTAFMFYKKAMRRLNADQNFGKKDNELQRKALIAGWKKLSAEDKSVYFKMENRARAEAQLLQLL